MPPKFFEEGVGTPARARYNAVPTIYQQELLRTVEEAGTAGLRARGQGGQYQTLVRRGWLTCQLDADGCFRFKTTPVGQRMLTTTTRT